MSGVNRRLKRERIRQIDKDLDETIGAIVAKMFELQRTVAQIVEFLKMNTDAEVRSEGGVIQPKSGMMPPPPGVKR